MLDYIVMQIRKTNREKGYCLECILGTRRAYTWQMNGEKYATSVSAKTKEILAIIKFSTSVNAFLVLWLVH